MDISGSVALVTGGGLHPPPLRRRTRPRVDHDDRSPQRRPLRRQRVQDVHHQRHQRRSGDHGGQDRSDAEAPRHLVAGGRARHGRLRARSQPRQARTARTGHRRVVAHRRSGPGGQPPGFRGGQGLPSAGDQPPAGTAVHRCWWAGRRSGGPGLEYVKSRKAFGQSIGSFQNSTFALAEIATEVDIAQRYVDDSVRALNDGELTAEDASKAKWWCTELQGRAVDRCLQFHGGYGYINEYPIARAPTPG